jgi:glycosyltransferase involved in cell wall biosynthesis
MKIVFLNPGGSLGGAERCLLDLAASIRASEPEVELALVAGGDGPLLDAARALGLEVVHLPLGQRMAAAGDSALLARQGPEGAQGAAVLGGMVAKGLLDAPAYAWRLRRTIRDLSATVVHSNGIKMHLLAAAAGGPAPLVWHVRDFIGDRPLVSYAVRAAAWRATVAIGISEAVARDMQALVPRRPCRVVHDAIDTDEFTPEGPAADLDALAGPREGPHRHDEVLRVGLVATYARWKGQDVFLDAVSRLKKAGGIPSTRFYVVGGPIYETAASQYSEAELRTLVGTLGVANDVRFVPFQRDVHRVFRALDVVVHASSRREPFGRTIAEAMATSKPVIATRESGAAEVFTDGVDAVAIPARDAAALAAALRALLEDPVRRKEMGRAARVTAVSKFSRIRLAQQVVGAYGLGAEDRGHDRAAAAGGLRCW